MTTILLLLSLTFHSFVPQGSFVIMGTVRNAEGRPVDSIRVVLMNEDYQVKKVIFTDPSGRYRFPPVSSGVYIVKIIPTGTPYEEVSQRLDLQSLSIRGGGGGASPGQGTTSMPSGGGAQEPTLVDFVIKRKIGAAASPANEVVFAQNIPDPARAEYKRGLDRLKDNKSDEGVAALKKAVEIFPDYYLALELLGTEYVKRGEFETALPILTHALEINRTASKSLYALGVAYVKLKRPAEAIQWLQKAAQQDPDNANIQMMLGLAYGYTNALKEAEAAFKKAYQLGGEQAAESHLYLAGIYNKQEKYSEAVRELELYLKEANEKEIDKGKVKEMINRLKEKQKAKS
jgi:predicted Zn-dependent protease